MQQVGFIIHEKKSVLVPVQNIIFLGNHIDSIKMIVYLTDGRKQIIYAECKSLRNKDSATIRQVARVIGLIVASFSAVELGPLFYRDLEHEKSKALSQHYGNYNAKMAITKSMKEELDWWVDNIFTAVRKICHGSPTIVIVTDASTTGWGAVCDEVHTGGRWSESEANHHINYLELLAIYLALKSFCKVKNDLHIQIRTDNTCAMSYLKVNKNCDRTHVSPAGKARLNKGK